MKIYGMKMNGIKDPIGFELNPPVCSWKVEGEESQRQIRADIEVSRERDFHTIYYTKGGEKLSSTGTVLEFCPDSCTRYYWRVRIQDEKQETTVSDPAYFETGRGSEPWDAVWISTRQEDTFHPVFHRYFSTKKTVKEAVLTICGLGLFEAKINGNKIGEEYLTPYINDYQSGYQYFTYHVEDSLQEENRLEVFLGNGWYKGRLIGGRYKWFGDRFALIAELSIQYEDGSREKIITDQNWSYSRSFIEESDIYDGEVENLYEWEKEKRNEVRAEELDWDTGNLCARYSLPICVQEELPVREIIHTPAGETVLDFGQNFAGLIEVRAELPAGRQVTLEFGEVLQQRNFYRDNYRTAKARYIFTADGNQSIYHPRFTYFGFRYVRVTGWPGSVKKENFTGKVLYSTMDRTGFLETGNAKINRLYQNTLWGLKSNFLDMPTDCPQRDERLGWTGDAQVFAATASYHMDTRAFYGKFMKDLGLDQKRHGGKIPFCLPNLDPGDTSSVWGDAATVIPTVLYRHYGDREALAAQYPVMKAWVDYIRREDEKRGFRYLFDFGRHFGDWLALDGFREQSFWGETDPYYIASMYYYASACMTAEAAKVLEKQEESEYYLELAEKIREALLRTYFSEAGHLTVNTQTGYLLALRFGVYRNQETLIYDLKKRFRKDCYRIHGGFVGATSMCTVLADYGMEKLAYDFLLQEEFPSWLYCVNLGATTIWERWNSILSDGSISGTRMNSLNHYSYGAVVEFLYRHAAGIIPEEPGFTRSILEPKPDKRLGWLKCRYDSAAGVYGVEWKWEEDGNLWLQIQIPFHATARLKLPYSNGKEEVLQAGTYNYCYKPENYRAYSWESTIGEIIQDPEAAGILYRILPQLEKMHTFQDPEDLAVTLEELENRMFIHVSHEQAEKVWEALQEYQQNSKSS